MKTIPNNLIWEDACKKKFIEPEKLESFCSALKKENKTIVTLNGSFDLMHAGHLYILFEAAKEADVFIVLLNSDRSIQAYKGKDRPIVSLKYRLEMISAIECVDFVSWFDETDPIQILEKVKPDIHANGIEYGENCIEKSTVEKNGGKIKLIPRIPGLATSEVIKKIKYEIIVDNR